MKVFLEYLAAVLMAVIVAISVRAFLFEAYRVPSAMMEPALILGDHIFVNKAAYKKNYLFGENKNPKRGDLVVINFLSDSKDYIKRVIAIEGDELEMINRVLYINGKEVSKFQKEDENYLYYYENLDSKKILVKWQKDKSDQDLVMIPKIKVPKNQVLVLGDFRTEGQDSRKWGAIDKKYIKGRAEMIWLSVVNGKILFKRIFKKL
jgi:signal peptidase I